MTAHPLLLTLALLPGAAAPIPAHVSPHRIDFATQIQPILTARCQPCHFPVGKMYASLPFDRAETVLRLREKLFTRLKDESERRTIRQFLAEHPAPAPAPPSTGRTAPGSPG